MRPATGNVSSSERHHAARAVHRKGREVVAAPLLDQWRHIYRGNFHIIPGVFEPVLAKHSKSFNLIDTLSVGVDRIRRNFEPIRARSRRGARHRRAGELIFYAAFFKGKLEAPKTLQRYRQKDWSARFDDDGLDADHYGACS